jgi:DNA-binding NarL/FixJ family response regulator
MNKATLVQDDILKLFTAGYSINDISEQIGYTKGNIKNILKSYGLTLDSEKFYNK